jgi:N-acetylglucosaminyl-diphospho-decaprenol L-rhamnosyltransferase
MNVSRREYGSTDPDHLKDTKPPSISIVIVNWNTRELLAACLRSLDVGRGSDKCEVIVVDNASRDGSADMVAACFPDVRLVRNDCNVGFARAVNQGVRLAQGPYILLLNSDTEATFDVLRRCVHYLDEHPDVAAVGCRLVFPDGMVQSSCFRFPSLFGVLLTSAFISQLAPHSRLLNWNRYGNCAWQGPSTVDCVMGSFMLVRRTAIEGNDLFDEKFFMYGEETDLCMRWRRNGLRVVHLPDVTIKHLHGGSAKSPAVRAWAYEADIRGVLRFLHKWRGSMTAYAANLIMLLGMFPRAFVWIALDLMDWPRGGLRWRRSLRIRAIRFHLAALVLPSLFESTWTGPDA